MVDRIRMWRDMSVCGFFKRKLGFESAIRRLGGGSVAEGDTQHIHLHTSIYSTYQKHKELSTNRMVQNISITNCLVQNHQTHHHQNLLKVLGHPSDFPDFLQLQAALLIHLLHIISLELLWQCQHFQQGM